MTYAPIPVAFYVLTTCKFCSHNMLLYYPHGRGALENEEYPLECWECHEHGFYYSSAIVTEN